MDSKVIRTRTTLIIYLAFCEAVLAIDWWSLLFDEKLHEALVPGSGWNGTLVHSSSQFSL
jgi:hypothetical protein